MCCDVVMCALVVVRGEDGKWKVYRKGFICAVIW
jgi:hypothetical protein